MTRRIQARKLDIHAYENENEDKTIEVVIQAAISNDHLKQAPRDQQK